MRTTQMLERYHEVAALARHFQMYEEARRTIGVMTPATRTAALERGLRDNADPRSVILAALIVQAEPRLLEAATRMLPTDTLTAA